MNIKEKEMVEHEIKNCLDNIDFYKKQLTDSKGKLEELQKLRDAFKYY